MTVKSKSSPRSSGGENKNLGKWRILLRRLSGRRWVRDNLYGMHAMRPYGTARTGILSRLWEKRPWRKVRQQSRDVRPALRVVRTRVSTRSPRRVRRFLQSSFDITERASRRRQYYRELRAQSGERTLKLRPPLSELDRLTADERQANE